MFAKVAVFVAGVVFAPVLMTSLFRLLDLDNALPALAVAAVLVLIGVLKGGLLRWAAFGLAIGVIGFEVFVVWLLGHFDGVDPV